MIEIEKIPMNNENTSTIINEINTECVNTVLENPDSLLKVIL